MATNLNQIVAKPVILIDTTAFLPPGVLNMQYVDAGEPRDVNSSGSAAEDITPIDPVDPIGGGGGGGIHPPPQGIRPPSWMTVISQTTRVLADGSFVVDLVVEIEDVPNVTNYDVRATKAVAPTP